MRHKAKFWGVAATSFVGIFFGAAPASAVDCGPYGCAGVYVVQPLDYPYAHHQYMAHGPDHDYSPMSFYDGHGGYLTGQWYWGGLTWRYGQPQYHGQFRADGW